MKRILKKHLKRALTPLAHQLGIVKPNEQKTAVFDKSILLNTFYTILKQAGFVPGHIVDVGANHGTWTRETLKYFPDAYYTLLEPQGWLKNSIDDLLAAHSKISFHAVGAGANTGSFKFTLHDRDDSCSFKYTAEEARLKGYNQIEIPVVTLNGLLAATALPVPDIIKIDAEGLDIEVLKGASNYLGKTEIFMVEAGVGNKEFQNSFFTVMNFMENNGYRLFDITDLNRPFTPSVLWLVELVFVKKDGIIDSLKIT